MKIKLIHGSNGDKSIYKNYLSISETKKTTTLLELENLFEKEVRKVRREYGIDKKWLTAYNPSDPEPYHETLYLKQWDEYKQERFFAKCREITSRLYLPYYWWHSIASLIAFNIFPTPDKTSLEIGARHVFVNNEFKQDWSNAQAGNLLDKGFVIIGIPEEMSRNSLHAQIDKQWDEIRCRMIGMHRPYKTEILRPQLAKEIAQMRDKDKLTFSVISDKLAERYAEDEELSELVSSEDYIKNLYHRWKKLRDKELMCPF